MTKRRSGEAVAAQHRKAGPMHHRLAPRGGASNPDYTEDLPRGRTCEMFEQPHTRCPMCGQFAICALPPRLLAAQPDGTNVVCHPAHGGCNHGFEEDRS